MTQTDLLELPDAVAKFNGFYTERRPFIMENTIRILTAMAVATALVLIAFLSALIGYLRHRRAASASVAYH
jgi:hypothetical protein